MRLVVHNVQVANRLRVEEITTYFDNTCDILVLVGTQQKAQDENSYTSRVITAKRSTWDVFEFGYRTKTQRHSGIVIAVRRRNRGSAVVQVYQSPTTAAALAGRFGALRLRSQHSDVTVVGLYFPPFTTKQNRFTYSKLIKQTDVFLSGLPTRSTPVLAMDANAKVGLQWCPLSNMHVQGASRAIGVHECDVENTQGTELRKLLEKQLLTLANTHCQAGPTYYNRNTSSRIDFVAIPQASWQAGRLVKCMTLLQDNMYVQNKASFHPRDHVPLLVELKVKLSYQAMETRGHRLDRCRLVQACRGKHDLTPFDAQLAANTSSSVEAWQRSYDNADAGAMYSCLIDDAPGASAV
eukprot:TRINITY_DN36919_c0_g2_i1.p1 TRINITY_DN36919_c0_g2~~TRINITY_DN36919_c0_g2_i1.p1  ORF type:complete len:352 (-),score=36.49 TRINITY_DN36919_c0_g2_i1:773-1828(-)